MNISQHSFVPLKFIKGYYKESKVLVDSYDVHSADLFHVDNCNSCVLYRQIGVSSVPRGGVFRFFNGNAFSSKFSIKPVSQFPYTINFTPASNMECTLSYNIPVGLVDFLVYDDPNVQPTRMSLGLLNDLNDEEENK